MSPGRRALAFALVVCAGLAQGCAALGTKTEGVAGPVSWQATDLDLSRRPVGNRDVWTYSFSVLLHEQQGVGLVFNEIRTSVYQPGIDPWSPTYYGVWPLERHGLMRIPLEVSLYCRGGANCAGPNVPTPLWQLVLKGRDEQKRPVSILIDITLPADPSTVPPTTSKSVPAITLSGRTPGRSP